MEKNKVNDENRVLRLLGVSNQKAESIKLVKGIVRRNSPISVLCPVLASGQDCRKGFKNYKGVYKRPKLLIKNHGDPRLQLWMCEGCKDKFLLRVKVGSGAKGCDSIKFICDGNAS